MACDIFPGTLISLATDLAVLSAFSYLSTLVGSLFSFQFLHDLSDEGRVVLLAQLIDA